MFQIKICGVRQIGDVAAVSRSAADAIGLNFFPKSVRYVDPSEPLTRELAEAATRAGLSTVGVFVNESADAIARIAEAIGLDQVQLHGDESIELASQLIARKMSVIRAIKLPTFPTGPYPIADRTTRWLDAGCALLLDADGGSAHGGSGQSLDWPSIGEWVEEYPDVEWALAGGLNVDNVAAAIAASRARSVDVASGVEQPRGTKSPVLIERFAQLASDAITSASSS